LVERAKICGFVFTDDVMLVLPKEVAVFLKVSRGFVVDHLARVGWAPGQLSTEAVSQIRQLFPQEIFDSDYMINRGRQILVYTPPELLIQAQNAEADQRAAEEDQEHPIPGEDAIPEDGKALEDAVFEHLADGLSDAGPPEMKHLDTTLDDTLDVIDEVILDPPLRVHIQEYSKAAADRISHLHGALTILRSQLHTWKGRWATLQRQYARTCRLLNEKKRIVEDRDRVIAELTSQNRALANPEPPQENPDHPQPEEPPIQEQFLAALCALAEVDANRREYPEFVKRICWMLRSLDPQSYRAWHELLPVPGETTLASYMREEKLSAASALTGEGDLSEYLQSYRRDLNITNDAEPSVLAFDATAVSATGVRLTKKRTESCFAFLLLPLDHRLPHVLVKSLLWRNGKMNDDILEKKNEVVRTLTANHFYCHFVATDGDSGMNELHNEAFEKYEQSNGILPDIIQGLTHNGERPLTEWPIPDLFHLEKNARGKLATNTMALHGESERTLTAASVADDLQSERMRKVLTARQPLDFLKDHLALETFTLENLLKLWATGNATAAYWMSPFVALNVAVRNTKITIEARLSFIQTAFSVFWDMVKDYPATGADAKIWESGAAGLPKTFYTHVVLKKGCNLCVGLYWAIDRWGYTQWGFCLALSRIGEHACECHFGMTRSTLNGDVRWARFLQAQVIASLIHRILREFGLTPYIRRFKNEAGCTLIPGQLGIIDIDFGNIVDLIEATFDLLRAGEEMAVICEDVTMMTPFQQLTEALGGIEYEEHIPGGSAFSGHGITTRMIALHGPRGE
jgi:hypothetical protein